MLECLILLWKRVIQPSSTPYAIIASCSNSLSQFVEFKSILLAGKDHKNEALSRPRMVQFT